MTPDDMLDVALDTGIDHAIMAMHDNPDLCFDLDLLDEQVHPEAFGEVLNQPWSERLEANALSQAVHDGIKYAFINADTED